MKRILICALAALAVFIAGTSMLRSHASSTGKQASSMMSLQEMHALAGVDKLPRLELEDRSLVFPADPQR